MRTQTAGAPRRSVRAPKVAASLLFVLALAALPFFGCAGGGAGRTYLCPMHPSVTSPRPGDCPVCNMRLVEKGLEESAHERAREHTPPEEARGSGSSPGDLAGHAPAEISPARAAAVNLETETVTIRRLVREVRASARVVEDETRLHRVTAKVGGWVETLHVNASGQRVRRGQPLLRLYSPELYAAEQEYLIARSHERELALGGIPEVARGGRDLLEASRKRLELWDVPEAEIRRLEREGRAERTVTLVSPASGFVAEKTVVEGQRIEPGEPLLLLSDLSTVWVEADLFEADAPLVEVDMEAEFVLPSLPGREFRGRVRFLNPFLDPATRTLRARLELANPGFVLKPGMLGEARLLRDFGERLSVRESALLRTSKAAFVYREGRDGRFEPVAVKTGHTGGGFVEVVSGLEPGDRVVTSGNFLVDSESSLAGALRSASHASHEK